MKKAPGGRFSAPARLVRLVWLVWLDVVVDAGLKVLEALVPTEALIAAILDQRRLDAAPNGLEVVGLVLGPRVVLEEFLDHHLPPATSREAALPEFIAQLRLGPLVVFTKPGAL